MCALPGVGVFVVLLWHRVARLQARAVALEVRPPQSTPLLRPPGHTLVEDLFRLSKDQESEATESLLAALLTGIGFITAIAAGSMWAGAPELIGSGAAITAIVCSLIGLVCGRRAFLGMRELMRLRQQVRNCRLGLRGEQAVAEALHSFEVACAGYVSFHDVPKPNGGNLDHVVIGPGGVFVIETKTRSQRKPLENKKRNRLIFDGRKTKFPAGFADQNAAEQVMRNAGQVRDWLADMVDKSAVAPLLVYPGWEVHMEQRCEPLKAMSPNQLRYYFRELPKILDEKTCKRVRGLFDEKCRDVMM